MEYDTTYTVLILSEPSSYLGDILMLFLSGVSKLTCHFLVSNYIVNLLTFLHNIFVHRNSIPGVILCFFVDL